jgi:hypothetical protein
MNRRFFIGAMSFVSMQLIESRAKIAIGSVSDSQYLAACLMGRMDFRRGCSQHPPPSDNDDRLLHGYLAQIGSSLHVAPVLKYLAGSSCDHGAYAESAAGQETVYVGTELVDAEFSNTFWGDVALRGILAHECAHLVQFRRGTGGRATRELEADYVAGYDLGARWRNESFDIDAFLNSILEKSDFVSIDRSHGTAAQRVRCIREGFKAGLMRQNVHEVFESAYSVAVSITRSR